MYNVKAYKNQVEFNADTGDVSEHEAQVLDLTGIIGHAFGTFTFTLFRENGGASVYRYDNFDRIEIDPVEEAVEVEEVTDPEEIARANAVLH